MSGFRLLTTLHRQLLKSTPRPIPAYIWGGRTMSDAQDEESIMNGSVVDGSTSNAIAGPSHPGGQPMSKNAMKRAEKRAKMEALKPEKRAAEKARRRERAAALREGHEAGTLTQEEKQIYEKRKALRIIRKKDTGKSKKDWKGGVVIDLGFDDLMTEQEINSMASQLAYVYASNRTAPHPISTVLHTSFGPTQSPKLWDRMRGRSWDKWTRSYWNQRGVGAALMALTGEAFEDADRTEGDLPYILMTGSGVVDELAKQVSGPILPATIDIRKHRLVYLSADAEEELSTLSEDEIYIIGGIVDRNRYKMLCQNKAEELGIRTARLPIGTYLANLQTRKVLTVNQVFEILLQYIAQKDWAKAFDAVIPIRKYAKSGVTEATQGLELEVPLAEIDGDTKDESRDERHVAGQGDK